jgi:hypothetical protein
MQRNVDIKNYMQQKHDFIIQTAKVADKFDKEDAASGKEGSRAGQLSAITPHTNDVL